MAAEARKYKIVVVEYFPSGITNVSATTIYDLTLSFSGIRPDNTTFTYSQIILSELIGLTSYTYSTRVDDFLYYIGVNTLDKRIFLKSEASYIENDCT